MFLLSVQHRQGQFTHRCLFLWLPPIWLLSVATRWWLSFGNLQFLLVYPGCMLCPQLQHHAQLPGYLAWLLSFPHPLSGRSFLDFFGCFGFVSFFPPLLTSFKACFRAAICASLSSVLVAVFTSGCCCCGGGGGA